jgi:hypothetical protein
VESVGDRAKAKPFLDAAAEHGEKGSCGMSARLAKRTFAIRVVCPRTEGP